MAWFGRKSPGDDDPDSTFIWKNGDDRRRFHFPPALFWIFSLLIHGSGFYLFQVVYPTPARVEPEAHAVTLLDPSQPETRVTLQRVRDRTIYLRSPSTNTRVRENLENHAVRFSPSFQSLSPGALAAEMEGILSDVSPLFPMIEKSPVADPANLELRLSPSLAERPLAPWSLLEETLARRPELPDLRMNLTVHPDGSVSGVERDTEALAPAEDATSDAAAGLEPLFESTLRFLPLPEDGGAKNGDTTGWIEVRSKEDSP